MRQSSAPLTTTLRPVPIPLWSAPRPQNTTTAGFPKLSGVEHYTVYYAVPANGTYNHGPIITKFNNTFFMTWCCLLMDEPLRVSATCCSCTPPFRCRYNGQQDEGVNNRVLIATSPDGEWSRDDIDTPPTSCPVHPS